MSDFLQTLLVRNSPNPPPSVLQPRLPALFESLEPANGPSLLTETTEEHADAAQTTPVRGFQPETDNQHRHFADKPDSAPPPHPDRLNPANGIATLDRPATETIRPPETELTGQPLPKAAHLDQAPTLPGHIQPEHASAASVQPQDTIVPPEHLDANPRPTPQPGTFIRPVTLPVSQVSKPASTNQAQANHAEPAEQDTTVRIHIGRIEVRTVMTQSPSQAVQRIPKSKLSLSLDDYLKQRSEGKR